MIPASEPTDGWDVLEKVFLREIILNVYRKIICPEKNIKISDKEALRKFREAKKRLENAFIFIAIQETGYTQEEMASILNISQVAVRKRFVNTLNRLRDGRQQVINY